MELVSFSGSFVGGQICPLELVDILVLTMVMTKKQEVEEEQRKEM